MLRESGYRKARLYLHVNQNVIVLNLVGFDNKETLQDAMLMFIFSFILHRLWHGKTKMMKHFLKLLQP